MNDKPFPGEGSYWRQQSDVAFTLLVRNRPVATVNLMTNVAIVTVAGATPERLAVPDSRPVVDAVEQRLGTGRVDEWLGLDGRPAIAFRHRTEDRATAFRRKISAAREPRHHLTSAWQWLDQGAYARNLSPGGERAHRHVREALRSFASDGEWTPEARRHIDQAIHALDGPQAEKQSYGEQQAGIDCAKGRACLAGRHRDHAFEKALRKATRQETERHGKDRGHERD